MEWSAIAEINDFIKHFCMMQHTQIKDVLSHPTFVRLIGSFVLQTGDIMSDG